MEEKSKIDEKQLLIVLKKQRKKLAKLESTSRESSEALELANKSLAESENKRLELEMSLASASEQGSTKSDMVMQLQNQLQENEIQHLKGLRRLQEAEEELVIEREAAAGLKTQIRMLMSDSVASTEELKLRKELETLSMKLEVESALSSRLRAELSAQVVTSGETKSTLDALEEEYNNFSRESSPRCSVDSELLVSTQKELESERDVIGILRNEVASLSTSLTEQARIVVGLELETQSLSDALETEQSTSALLSCELNALQKVNENLLSEVQKANNEASGVEKLTAEKEASSTLVSKLEKLYLESKEQLIEVSNSLEREMASKAACQDELLSVRNELLVLFSKHEEQVAQIETMSVLSAELETLKVSSDLLQDEQTCLLSRLNEKTSDCETLQNTVAALERRHEKSQRDLESVTESLKQLQAFHDDSISGACESNLQSQLESLTRDHSQEREISTAAILELTQTNTALENHVTELKAQLSQQRLQHNEELEKMQNYHEKLLQSQSTSTESSNRIFESRVTEYEASISELEAELNKCRSSGGDYSLESKIELEATVDTLKQSLVESSVRIDELTEISASVANVQDLLDTSETVISVLKAAEKELLQRLKLVSEENETLRYEVKETMNTLALAKNEQDTKNAELELLRHRIEEISLSSEKSLEEFNLISTSLKASNLELSIENESLESRIVFFESENADLNSMISSLEEKLTSKAVSENQLLSIRGELISYESQVKDLTSEIALMQESYDNEKTSFKSEQTALQKLADDREVETNELRSIVAQLKKKMAIQSDKTRVLQTRLSEADDVSMMKALQDQEVLFNTERMALTEELNTLRIEMEQSSGISNELIAKEKMLANMSSNIDALEKEKKKMKNFLVSANKKIQGLKAEIQVLQSDSSIHWLGGNNANFDILERFNVSGSWWFFVAGSNKNFWVPARVFVGKVIGELDGWERELENRGSLRLGNFDIPEDFVLKTEQLMANKYKSNLLTEASAFSIEKAELHSKISDIESAWEVQVADLHREYGEELASMKQQKFKAAVIMEQQLAELESYRKKEFHIEDLQTEMESLASSKVHLQEMENRVESLTQEKKEFQARWKAAEAGISRERKQYHDDEITWVQKLETLRAELNTTVAKFSQEVINLQQTLDIERTTNARIMKEKEIELRIMRSELLRSRSPSPEPIKAPPERLPQITPSVQKSSVDGSTPRQPQMRENYTEEDSFSNENNLNSQISRLQGLLRTCELRLFEEQSLRVEMEHSMDRANRSKKRSGLDVDYLKNVLVSFMSNPNQAEQLIPVIGRLLEMDQEEVGSIVSAREASAQVSSTGWIW